MKLSIKQIEELTADERCWRNPYVLKWMKRNYPKGFNITEVNLDKYASYLKKLGKRIKETTIDKKMLLEWSVDYMLNFYDKQRIRNKIEEFVGTYKELCEYIIKQLEGVKL